jgi:hypothetical protein
MFVQGAQMYLADGALPTYIDHYYRSKTSTS